MNEMRPWVRRNMQADSFYSRCARRVEGDCKGRITWEHALYYRGKQIQEWWAIIPLCEYHHSVGAFMNGGKLDKRLNEMIALSRGFSSVYNQIKMRYPRAIDEWTQKLRAARQKYGIYKIEQQGDSIYGHQGKLYMREKYKSDTKSLLSGEIGGIVSRHPSGLEFTGRRYTESGGLPRKIKLYGEEFARPLSTLPTEL